MNLSVTDITKHMSFIWGVVLALITILDWNSLDRDPMHEQILTPFIKREITLVNPQQARTNAPMDERPAAQYEVALSFDGPLFLLVFFGPVLLLFGIGQVISRLKNPEK